MAKKHGKNFRVYIDGDDFSGVSNATELNWTTAMAEVTNYLSDNVERLPGVTDWTATVNGFWDSNDATGYEELLEEKKSGSVIFGAFPNKANTGEMGWEGTPYLTDYGITGPVDGPVATGLSFTGSARLSRTYVLAACTGIEAASTNGTSAEIGNSETTAAGFLRLTSASSDTGSAYAYIEHSPAASGTWATLASFLVTAASGAWTASTATAPSAFLRGHWNITGSDTNVDFILSVETYS